jgi:hypothetical protein
MRVLGFSILVLASVLAASYELRISTPSVAYAESDGPFTCTLVGESKSQAFDVNQNIYNGPGISSQILTTDWDLGELHEILLTSGTVNAWYLNAVWLNGTLLALPAEIFVFEKDGSPCNFNQHSGWSSNYKSWSCGNTLRFFLQKGYLGDQTFVFGLNKPTGYCLGANTDGPVHATLHGTTGNFSFYLEDDMCRSTGASEMNITADVGDAFAVTIETETEDALLFDKVWLSNIDFKLPAELICMEDEGGYCKIREHSCSDRYDSMTCVISVTLYLDYSTRTPSTKPTVSPTELPSSKPTILPTISPTRIPSSEPTPIPTRPPNLKPPTLSPTRSLSPKPTLPPTLSPTRVSSSKPTNTPTLSPTRSPSSKPLSSTSNPTRISTTPSLSPTEIPSTAPTLSPSYKPTLFEDGDDSLQSDMVHHIFRYDGSVVTLVASASIICFCCAFIISCASVYWVRRNKSSSVALMLELEEFRQSMMEERMRPVSNTKMETHDHDSMLAREGQTGVEYFNLTRI